MIFNTKKPNELPRWIYFNTNTKVLFVFLTLIFNTNFFVFFNAKIFNTNFFVFCNAKIFNTIFLYFLRLKFLTQYFDFCWIFFVLKSVLNWRRKFGTIYLIFQEIGSILKKMICSKICMPRSMTNRLA